MLDILEFIIAIILLPIRMIFTGQLPVFYIIVQTIALFITFLLRKIITSGSPLLDYTLGLIIGQTVYVAIEYLAFMHALSSWI